MFSIKNSSKNPGKLIFHFHTNTYWWPGSISLWLALMMECPKAGEFQSALKAGVTDRTPG